MRPHLSAIALGEPLVSSQYPDGDGVRDLRIAHEHDLLKGEARRIALDGITIYRGRHQVSQDIVLHSEQNEPTLALHFNFGARSALEVRPHAHTVAYVPEALREVLLDAGRDYEAFEINLSRAYLDGLTERHPRLLETVHTAVDREELLRTPPRPISLSMHAAIREIEESAAYGNLRAAFIEAKVLELFIQQLTPLERHSGSASELSQRDKDRMWEAREILLDRMIDPPSLVELAHRVGTNEFKLKQDFKALFRTTAFKMLRQHRMAHARNLLLDTDLTIQEIAERVGYRHGSHFSTAFKRMFGHPPSLVRS